MNKEKALFLVASPFQALCAGEAVSHYKIKEAHFLLFNDPIVMEKVYPLCERFGIVRVVNQTGGTFGLIKALHKIKVKFDHVFIGDYYSYGLNVAAILMAKRGSMFTYLDDGNSTLMIAPPISLERGRSRREKTYIMAWDCLAKLKRIEKRLFTIFDLNNDCPLKVEKNTFSSLLPKDKTLAGVYVIGTNTDLLKFRTMSYTDTLTQLDTYIRKLYPKDSIYYCPHRRDSHDYSTYIKALGWHFFDTHYNVELDFIQKGIYPRMVVGFGSTALLTLKKIFLMSRVETVYFEVIKEELNKGYRAIEEVYRQNGVPTVSI